MKIRFYRGQFYDQKNPEPHHMNAIDGDESLRILIGYLGGNIQSSVNICEMVIEGIQKVKSGEKEVWGDEGNGHSSNVTLESVELHDEYTYPPDNNILSLSLDQFEKSVIGWKKFLEDESLMEYEIDL